MQSVQGRVAVVTGGASGIGRAIAHALGAEGMKLVVADVDEAGAQSAARGLAEAGVEAIAVRTDVAKAAEVEALAARALDAFGAVHVVCNNAGVAYGGMPTWEAPLADWEWVVGVNLMGVVHGVHTFAPLLIAQGEGHIVNTASIAGLITVGGNALYAVTKHAVVALSETLFNELAVMESGVHVSVLCPGFVNTGLIESSERNAPEVARANPLPFGSDAAQEIKAILSAGLAPEEVGRAVLSAVLEERFWILTHPELEVAIRSRCENLLDKRPPTVATMLRREA